MYRRGQNARVTKIIAKTIPNWKALYISVQFLPLVGKYTV